ncbi:WG repeat-containing protein [Microcoleus sp. FACHB-68]|uniref:WG repeat-containing protein n=1 Tax=Microcoleus sp. FACHB-68 TaxID=2692826 RepID=UPI001684340D|nr:WG repeat-containing protein [Microcoleus sp. FACHB-68]MBD1937714.1 WG repeat-containing protein [Microcoleus sp. FACHB-68]
MASSFSDIEKHWAQACISQLQTLKIAGGYPDGSFRPDATITRAEFAVLMCKAFPNIEKKRNAITFKDVPATHWAYEAVKTAYEKEFFTGYPDGTFQPTRKLQRVQALVILANGLKYTAPANSSEILKRYYEDAMQIPNYAINAVAAATAGLLVVNYPNIKQLKPNQDATRGEVAAMLSQALHLSNTVPKQYVAGSELFAIQPQFYWAASFSEGLAMVTVNTKSGFIDKTGNFIIQPKFDHAGSFSEGLAPAKLGEKWGYIDRAGNFIIQPPFTSASSFADGLAPAKIGEKWGYINKTGDFVTPQQFDAAEAFSDGMARVKIGEKYGYINTTGTLVIPPKFSLAYSFSEGLAAVYAPPEREGALSQWGYIDKTGNFVIEPLYSFAYPFSDGLANIGTGYIDKTGNFVFSSQQLEDSRSFSEGLAAARVGGKWGYIDKTGKLVIQPQFYGPKNAIEAEAAPFSEGLALVRIGNKAGFIDKTGKFVFPAQFDNAYSFSDGMALVNVGGKWETTVGYDSSANPVVETNFRGGIWGYLRNPLK